MPICLTQSTGGLVLRIIYLFYTQNFHISSLMKCSYCKVIKENIIATRLNNYVISL